MIQVATFRLREYHGTYDRPEDWSHETIDALKQHKPVFWDGTVFIIRTREFYYRISFSHGYVTLFRWSLPCTYDLEWLWIESDVIEFMVKGDAVTSCDDLVPKFPPQWWAQVRLAQAWSVPVCDDLRRAVFGFLY